MTGALRKTLTIPVAMFLASALGRPAWANSDSAGTAKISLEFSPANPSMTDGRLGVRVLADLRGISTSGGSPTLAGFAIPVGFDPSRVWLASVAAGQASGFSRDAFASTDPSVANARGFVTLINTRTSAAELGTQVELARLEFEIRRAGKALFLAGTDRTIHRGTLGISTAGSDAANVERAGWEGRMYTLQIGSGAAAQILFCPSWFSKPGTFQGLAFLNEGGEEASVQVFGWGSNGAAVPPSAPFLLPPLHQEAKLTEEILRNTPDLERGRIEARADRPDITGFFMQGVNSPTGISEMDGAPMVYQPSARIVFPLVGSDSSRATEIWLANPGNTSVRATIRLMSSAGSTVRTSSAQVAAHGTLVQELSETAGYMEVDAADGQLLGFERFGTSSALAVLGGQDIATASNRLVAPQFASGYLGGNLRINTGLVIVNPSDTVSRVILRLSDDQGREMTAPVVRSMDAKSQLSGSGWELFGLPDPMTTAQLLIGTVAVESEKGVLGALTFGDPVAGSYLTALPLMSTSAAKREIFFGHVAAGLLGNVDYFTGLALVNPSATTTANIHLELYDKSGNIVAATKTPCTLGPNSRTAKLVQQLIPEFTGSQFGGFIHLVSDVEVYAFMLFGDTSYNFLSAVPTP